MRRWPKSRYWTRSTTMHCRGSPPYDSPWVWVRLGLPVVLVKPDGFAVMQGLARAAAKGRRIALVTYGTTSPELQLFNDRYGLQLEIRAYASEAEAEACVEELASKKVEAV